MIPQDKKSGNFHTMNIFYERLASLYDILSGTEKKFVYEGLARLNLTGKETVLDIGCGAGHALLDTTRLQAEKGIGIGLDLSRPMLRIAQRRIRIGQLSKQLFLLQADAVRLPFPDEKFDVVLSSFTIELLAHAEIISVLKECSRILKPAGKILIVSLSNKGKDTWMRKVYKWSHRKFPNWIDCRPIDPCYYLTEGSFRATDCTLTSLWGLPIEIIIARKALFNK